MMRFCRFFVLTCIITILSFFSVSRDICFAGPNDNMFTVAENYISRNQPDSAAALIKTHLAALTTPEDSVRAFFLLAESRKHTDDKEERISYLRQGCDMNILSENHMVLTMALIESHFSNNLYHAVIDEVDIFISKYPTSTHIPESIYYKGVSLYKLEDYHEAYTILAELQKSNPESPWSFESIVFEGISMYHLGFDNIAVERLSTYIDDPKGNKLNLDTALYYLAVIYDENNDHAAAAHVLQKLISTNPEYPEMHDVYYRLGENAFMAGKYTTSKSAFTSYVADENKPASQTSRRYDSALYYLERIKYKTGIYRSETEIAVNFVNSYPQSPRTPRLLLWLGRYYALTGNSTDAEHYLINILKNKAYNAFADSAMVLLVDMKNDTGGYDEVVTFLRKIESDYKGTVVAQSAHYRHGLFYEKFQLYDQAISQYNHSLDIGHADNLSASSLIGIGRCLVEINMWRDAIDTFQRAIKTYPRESEIVEAHRMLGNLYYTLGRIDMSIDETMQAAERENGPEKIDLYLFAASLYEFDNDNLAQRLYKEIISHNDATPKHRMTATMKLGDISMRNDDAETALRLYNSIISTPSFSEGRREARQKINVIKSMSQ